MAAAERDSELAARAAMTRAWFTSCARRAAFAALRASLAARSAASSTAMVGGGMIAEPRPLGPPGRYTLPTHADLEDAVSHLPTDQ
ncbi:hypothetical protein ACIBI9_16985 [Nonomuraea sp. NPDC050451]|uniref:hypothetical protein n=1 Tax=Nonomuraea sp. NPDC050451 TaxID=3364364 RepID=UPI0037AFEE20